LWSSLVQVFAVVVVKLGETLLQLRHPTEYHPNLTHSMLRITKFFFPNCE
jgi:hypothetical protein